MRSPRLPSRLFSLVTIASTVFSSVLVYSSAGVAADKVVLQYGILRQSVSVPELSTFAKTGELSPTLEWLFRTAKQEPQEVQNVLNRPVKVEGRLLDRALNNPLGETLLDQVGEAIRTPTNTANRQALRSALVLSTTDDDQLSLIEVLEKYPTSEVQVDGKKLLNAYSQIDKLAGYVRRILGAVENF